MYHMVSLFTGLIIAVMVALNGSLTLQYGNFNAAVIIHVVGVVFAFLFCRLTKKRIALKKGLPVWLYLGGAIGVLTTVFNNFAYGKISLTSIVALGLFGQTVISLFIDSLGLFGMKKHPFRKSSITGLVFSFTGILVMLDASVDTALYAVLLSICAGITVVLSRTVNARLSQYAGELQSSFINHVIGLPIAVAIAAVLEKNSIISSFHEPLPGPWIYLGGVLGVSAVFLCNITVPRVAAFRLTLLTFVGQVFTGIVIDIFAKSEYTESTFIGGVLVAAGIALNMIYEQVLRTKESKDSKYRERLNSLKKDYQNRLLELAKEPIASHEEIVFETRPKGGICCPYCWTVQSSQRNFCRGYRCNTKFVFRDEAAETKN